MTSSLKNHLNNPEYNIPQDVVNTVCTIFPNNKVDNILNSLSAMKPGVCTIALGVLRQYSHAMNGINNPVFPEVVRAILQDTVAANDPYYSKGERKVA